MNDHRNAVDVLEIQARGFETFDPVDEHSPAWEQIDVDRYMPRRIRGSCKGRQLG